MDVKIFPATGNSPAKDLERQTVQQLGGIKSSKRKANPLEHTTQIKRTKKPITNGTVPKVPRHDYFNLAARSRSSLQQVFRTHRSPRRPVYLACEPSSPTDREMKVITHGAAGKVRCTRCEMVGVGPTPDNDSQVAVCPLSTTTATALRQLRCASTAAQTYRDGRVWIRRIIWPLEGRTNEVRKDVVEMLNGALLWDII